MVPICGKDFLARDYFASVSTITMPVSTITTMPVSTITTVVAGERQLRELRELRREGCDFRPGLEEVVLRYSIGLVAYMGTSLIRNACPPRALGIGLP